MAHCIPHHLAIVLLTGFAQAGELTIQPTPFFTEQTFGATVIPNETTHIRLEPKAWSDFEFTRLAAHGSKVGAGEVLAAFDSEDIDKKLTDAGRTLATSELTHAQAALDFANLTETVPLKLDALRRAARNAKEENEYFTTTRRKAAEEHTAHALKRAKETLENQQEELRQLTKMYAADDLVEETEEIILTRQRDAVEHAAFALRMEQLDHDRTLKVSLPREAETLTASEHETALALSKGEADLPRQLKLQKIQLEAATTALGRDKDALAKLQTDRKLFEIKAPAAGWFYYGSIEDGRWSTGELLKTLMPGGQAPIKRTFATFIPASTKLGLTAFVDDAAAHSLTPELKGRATLAGREELDIPIKLSKLAETPATDGRYRASFEVSWPAAIAIAPGSSAEVSLITYEKAAAIAVPTKALTFTPAGWTAEVKLADGKTERRPVKRGRASKNTSEILSGLEAGQVILTP
jgi:HlyD family secretion protein